MKVNFGRLVLALMVLFSAIEQVSAECSLYYTGIDNSGFNRRAFGSISLADASVKDLNYGKSISFLAYDPVAETYYYVDESGHAIISTKGFGAKPQLVRSGDQVPGQIWTMMEDLAVDSVNRKLYWVERKGGYNHLGFPLRLYTSLAIMQSNLDGSGVGAVVYRATPESHYRPGSLVLVPKMNLLFWLGTQLTRAELNGDNEEELPRDKITAYAVDPLDSTIYFSDDAGDGIKRMTFDGTEIVTAIPSIASAKYLWINAPARKLYYSVDYDSPMRRVNLNGSRNQEIYDRWTNPRWYSEDGSRVLLEETEGIALAGADMSNIEFVIAFFDGAGYLAIDSAAGLAYLPSASTWLGVADIHGDSFKRLVDGFEEIVSVVVDKGRRKLYFADRKRGVIYQANLDGSNVSEFRKGLAGVEDLELTYKNGGHLFWSQNEGENGQVMGARLDGSETKVIYSEKRTVRGLAVDRPGNRVYWAVESNTASQNPGLILSSDPQGEGRQTEVEMPMEFQHMPNGGGDNYWITTDPRGLVIDNGQLYWTTSHNQTVETFVNEEIVTVVHRSRDFDGLALGCSDGTDFTGDQLSEFSVWRPSEGIWYVSQQEPRTRNQGPMISGQWGLPGDVPVLGDFDADGSFDMSVWRPATGSWFICSSGLNFDCSKSLSFSFGLPGDYPLAADLDGDGISDPTVWRPVNGQWYSVLSSTGQQETFQWGVVGDLPVVADYDGDGEDDPAVWRPTDGYWYIQFSTGGSPKGFSSDPRFLGDPSKFRAIQFGLPGDHPLVGDLDGDGASELIVWRPTTGMWYVAYSGSGFSYTTHSSQQFGLPGDKPMLADFDNDGELDYAVWREHPIARSFEAGLWYYLSSFSGEVVSKQWGVMGDIPLRNDVRSMVEAAYPDN